MTRWLAGALLRAPSWLVGSGQRAAGGCRGHGDGGGSLCRSTWGTRLDLARAGCGKVQRRPWPDVSSTYLLRAHSTFCFPIQLSPGDVTGDQSNSRISGMVRRAERGRGSRGAKTPMPASRPAHLGRSLALAARVGSGVARHGTSTAKQEDTGPWNSGPTESVARCTCHSLDGSKPLKRVLGPPI